MKHLITLSFCLYSLFCFSQNFATDNPAYVTNVELGAKAMEAEKYDSCVVYYKTAFAIKQTSYLSTMRAAACAYSASNTKYLELQLDSAFSINWGGSKDIFDNYKEFRYLDDTPFADMVQQRFSQRAEEEGINIALMEELDHIRYEDQRYRLEMRGVQEKYGWDSPQMDSLWGLQNPADSLNTLRIIEMIEEYGYPGKSLVGPSQSSTAFLVIQHADQAVQEKYLPIITAAADQGEVPWSSVALLIDRVNLKQGKPQIYGSQVSRDPDTGESFFSEIAEPYKVDSIRSSVGLPPLSAYAEYFEFKWDPDTHVERVKAMKTNGKWEKKE